MQDETEGALRMLELGNDPPHDIVDHALPQNLFMANLWIRSGGPFLLYICKQGGGGICQKLMQYYGFIINSDVILHNGGGRGSKKRLEFCVNTFLFFHRNTCALYLLFLQYTSFIQIHTL